MGLERWTGNFGIGFGALSLTGNFWVGTGPLPLTGVLSWAGKLTCKSWASNWSF